MSATSSKVRATVLHLEQAGEVGVTWRELAAAQVWGHGSCSRVLSDLHRDGEVARLEEKRDRCSVYVLATYTRGRPTIQHGRVTLDAQALSQTLAEKQAMASEVERIVHAYGLQSSRFPTIVVLGNDLLNAVGRNMVEGQDPTLPMVDARSIDDTAPEEP